jgi:hypothetical protein
VFCFIYDLSILSIHLSSSSKEKRLRLTSIDQQIKIGEIHLFYYINIISNRLMRAKKAMEIFVSIICSYV